MKWLSKNKILLLLFGVSTIFFILQHVGFLGWDFSVYVLNAKYLFSHGNYFEWGRAPLMSLLMGLFSFFGAGSYVIAQYLYIILASFLFFVSSKLIADKFKLNPLIFYALVLSPFVLLFGLIEGTELLTAAFLMFAVYFIKSGKKWSAFLVGIFIGLAFLTRFNASLFIFLILFQLNFKKILISFGSFLLVPFCWSMYTLSVKSSVLISQADNFGLNSYFRGYIHQPFNFGHLLSAFNYYYIIFFVLGIITVVTILSMKKKHPYMKKKELLFNVILMAFITILAIYSYTHATIKISRYLFFIFLPLTYFSTVFLQSINKKKLITILLIAIILFNFGYAFAHLNFNGNPSNSFRTISKNLDKNCMYVSDKWIYFDYFGITTEAPTGFHDQFIRDLNNGKRFIIFRDVSEPDFLKNRTYLESLPLINKTDNYLIIGNSSFCMFPYKVDKSYLDAYRENNLTKLTNCQVVMPKWAEFVCKGRYKG